MGDSYCLPKWIQQMPVSPINGLMWYTTVNQINNKDWPCAIRPNKNLSMHKHFDTALYPFSAIATVDLLLFLFLSQFGFFYCRCSKWRTLTVRNTNERRKKKSRSEHFPSLIWATSCRYVLWESQRGWAMLEHPCINRIHISDAARTAQTTSD